MNKKRVAIIGAGSSGLVATKILLEVGHAVTTFEIGQHLGGQWVLDNSNGLSSMYHSCHINTSKQLMAYSDFPMPESYPDYPHHSHIAEYFQTYAQTFQLLPHIRFNSQVTSVTLQPNTNLWQIKLADGYQDDFDALIIATGHHSIPQWPTLPGNFTGELLHTKDYRKPQPFKDKNVLIIGLGNSGVDIACELAHTSKHVFVSLRRSYTIFPKYAFGKPLDHVTYTPRGRFFPARLGRILTGLWLWQRQRQLAGKHLPKPTQPWYATHPTMSDTFLQLVGEKKITVCRSIDHIKDHEVIFTDGKKQVFDTIICATGYQIQFPFLAQTLLPVDNNIVHLYKHVVHPQYNHLFFIGLAQPLGAIMPIAEMQARWVAGILAGIYTLPSTQAQYIDIKRAQRINRKRYIPTARHTIQVSFQDYLAELERVMLPNRFARFWHSLLRKPDRFSKIFYQRVQQATSTYKKAPATNEKTNH